ncbi:MAG: hypothetical protein ACREXU_19650 [Gammaproteobacteria bacterium]
MIKSENTRPNDWGFVDTEGRDLGGYVAEAKARVASEVGLPPGYSVSWSGQYEYLKHAPRQARMLASAWQRVSWKCTAMRASGPR